MFLSSLPFGFQLWAAFPALGYTPHGPGLITSASVYLAFGTSSLLQLCSLHHDGSSFPHTGANIRDSKVTRSCLPRMSDCSAKPTDPTPVISSHLPVFPMMVLVLIFSCLLSEWRPWDCSPCCKLLLLLLFPWAAQACLFLTPQLPESCGSQYSLDSNHDLGSSLLFLTCPLDSLLRGNSFKEAMDS